MPSSREMLMRARAALRPPPEACADGWARLHARIVDANDVPELPRVPAMADESPRRTKVALAAAIALAAAVVAWMAANADLFGPTEAPAPQLAPDGSVGTTADGNAAPAPSREQMPEWIGEPDPREVPAPFAEVSPSLENRSAPPRASESAPTTRRETRRHAKSTGDELAAELALLQSAERSLARGDATGALYATRDHARRFPRGALAEERWALHVHALCDLGRIEDATREAARFARAHPQSAVSRALRRDPCANP